MNKHILAPLTGILLVLFLLSGCNMFSEKEDPEAAKLTAMQEQLAEYMDQLEENKESQGEGEGEGENEAADARQRELEGKIAAMQAQLAAAQEELEASKRQQEFTPDSGSAGGSSSSGFVPDEGGSGGSSATSFVPDPTPPEPEPRVVTLPAGTPIRVRTTTAMSTKTTQTGQSFVASLEEPLTDGQWIVASKGARVEGVVAESSKGKRGKNDARLVLRLTSIETDDGQDLDINTGTIRQGAVKPKTKKQAAKVGIASGIGAGIGAIAGGGKGAAIGAGAGAGAGAGSILLTHGPPAEMAAESVVSFELANAVTITERK